MKVSRGMGMMKQIWLNINRMKGIEEFFGVILQFCRAERI